MSIVNAFTDLHIQVIGKKPITFKAKETQIIAIADDIQLAIDVSDVAANLKQLILSALPEKHNAPLSPEFKANDEGYNQALEEVTKALTALFEGEQSK